MSGRKFGSDLGLMRNRQDAKDAKVGSANKEALPPKIYIAAAT
jgi:hypothetical protein